MRAKLKEQRIKKRYTHESISKVLGINRSTYTNIENGKKNPSFIVALKIKKILEYNNDDIFYNQMFLKETNNCQTA